MTSLNDREQTFENKYAHDEALRFKVAARRNRLLGEWAAEKLGKTGADAEAYAKQVVLSDFEKPGDEDVLEKVLADLTTGGITIDAARVRQQMDALLIDAKAQVMAE